MYKALNEAKNSIENKLANLIEVLRSNSTSDAKQIKNKNNMLETVERILFFHQQNQAGKGLKILTPNQMLSRLSISLS